MHGFAFQLEQRLDMRRIENHLSTVVGSWMTCEFHCSVEDANRRIRGSQHEGMAYGFGRNGVVIQIETYIDRLAGGHRFDAVCAERMQWRRKQAGLFIGKDLLH